MKTMCLTTALAFAFIAAGATAAPAQQQPGRATDRKPAESRPPVAQYDIGHIARRLAALEAQVAELKKKNDALASELSRMKQKDALDGLTAGNVGTLKGGAPSRPSFEDRLRNLERAMGSHTHYLPGIGVMALNALPGMQDIANKAGAGYAVQQWKDIKVHVTFGTGGGPERTGPPVSGQ